MPSSPSSSVQQAKRVLGLRLRELRQDARLTQATLAGRCGWERTKVTKIETGVQTPSIDDVAGWCAACSARDEAEHLIATLRTIESAYMEWRRLERAGLRRLQEQAGALYERTRKLRVYQSQVVPGLLQAPGYIAALLRSISRFDELPEEMIEPAVAARVERQRVLRGRLRYAVVIEEAVLRYGVGGREVMASQLRHLLDVMTMPAVSLAIIPFDRRPRPLAPAEGFLIFDGDRVHVELLAAKVTITQPREVAVYARAFGELHAAAVTGRPARALIAAALGEVLP